MITLLAQRPVTSKSGGGGVVNLVKSLMKRDDIRYYLGIEPINDFICKVLSETEGSKYVCMCPQTANALAKRGIPYHFVYHQQGSVAYEAKIYGYPAGEEIEDMAFDCVSSAETISFPSRGAKWALEQTLATSLSNVLDIPLYNTYLETDTTMNEKEQALFDRIMAEVNGPIILSIGQLTEAKGILGIPEILKMIGRDAVGPFKIPYTWISIGTGPMKSRLHSFTEENWINVEQCPHNVAVNLMKAAKIYLMNHKYSINDIATIEAVFNDVPLVLSNVPGNDEFNSALIYDKPTMAAKHITDLLTNDVYYQAVRNTLRKDKQKFSNDMFVNRYENYFTMIEGV